jgi:hypothetical protein
LDRTQPGLCESLPSVPEGSEFVYGRDGCLTAKGVDGRWLAGCSLPRRAALAQLKDLEARNTTTCFLAPPHGAHVRVALDRLRAQQAVVAAVPDASAVGWFLRCEDFSADIGRGRLWFVTGDDWAGQLDRLLSDHVGLPTPTAFIRTIMTPDAVIDPMIAAAQQVFSTTASRRAQRIQSAVQSGHDRPRRTGRPRLCVIAPSAFRLWDPSADVLRDATSACERIVFDSDRPTSASPVALAEAIAASDAVVSANVARADAVGLARPDLPWITWLTQPRVPAASAAGPNDHLLLADPAWTELARQAGWPAARIHAAGWPVRQLGAPTGEHLALIADTTPVEVAPETFELSSHSLLWESIRQQLLENPLDLDEDPGRYLLRWMKRCDVSPDGLDQAMFIDRLIVPTYQQSLARLLERSRIPIKLYGAGWESLTELAACRAGGIGSADDFDAAVSSSRGLVYAWPVRTVHPVDAVGRAVVRSAGRHREAFLHDARLAIKGQLPLPSPATAQTVSAELILQWVE